MTDPKEILPKKQTTFEAPTPTRAADDADAAADARVGMANTFFDKFILFGEGGGRRWGRGQIRLKSRGGSPAETPRISTYGQVGGFLIPKKKRLEFSHFLSNVVVAS